MLKLLCKLHVLQRKEHTIKALAMLKGYDKYIVAFSGGKDSTAVFLHLLEQGIPKEKIELWHHLIDGRGDNFMDWEITEDYCRKFAEAFGVPIYFSWKKGGFRGEMLRENERTKPTVFETPEGIKETGGNAGKESTRRKFPQISPDLSVRWCSAYLKIDICATAIRNQDRFNGIKTVVLSGERGEESSARAKYAIKEPDKSDLRNGKRVQRYVDRIRPIRDWKEEQVWDIIRRFKVRSHPAYFMGWSRCSCKFCIFGNADQFASAYKVDPDGLEVLAELEDDFGVTMKRTESLAEVALSGEAYPSITDELALLSISEVYTHDIFMEEWILPEGAYGESCGPS